MLKVLFNECCSCGPHEYFLYELSDMLNQANAAGPLSPLSLPQTALVHGVMVSRCEEDLLCVRAAFLKLTGTSLYTALQVCFSAKCSLTRMHANMHTHTYIHTHISKHTHTHTYAHSLNRSVPLSFFCRFSTGVSLMYTQ
jgi:hypothetical protein